MESTIIALVSILIGVATPFIQLQSNVLSRIDKDVKSDLHIEYRGVKVESLQQAQFLIANTGERAIRDLIKPLCLQLPIEVEVMDASILFTSPEGREVSLEVSEKDRAVSFVFPLLNKDEFFIFKLLLKGEPDRKQFKFSVVGDDLPPTLNIKRLTYNQIESEGENESKSNFEMGPFAASWLVIFCALCLGILAHYIDMENFPTIHNETWLWVNSIPFVSIASVVGYVLAGMFGLAGAMMISASIFGELEFPKSKKFKLPKEFATASYDFRGFEDMVLIDGKSANTIVRVAAEDSTD